MEKIKQLWRRSQGNFSGSLFVAFVALLAVVAYVGLTKPLNANAAFSGVTLADNDLVDYGLDGRHFTITWNAGTSSPGGYVFTKIYITTNTQSLATSTLTTTGCNGSPCQEVGFLNQASANNFTLPQFVNADSNNIPFVTSTSYVAWVFASSTNPSLAQLVSSSPVSYANSFRIVTSTNPPQINHSPVHAAVASQNAIINALVFHDQTSASQFASGASGAFINLYYGANVLASVSVTSAVQVTGSLFSFTVPSASVPAAGNTFQYYLVARDLAGNKKFLCASPNANSTSSCQTSPFVVNTISAGSRTVTGTIKDISNNSPLVGATVFVGGFATSSVTTDGLGNYAIIGLPNNDSFDFTAYKTGYCQNTRFQTIGVLDITGVNLNLNPGGCGFFMDMGGGGGGAPIVIFSGPFDGMQNVSPAEKIRIGLSQAMNANTITNQDATQANSKIYLTSDGVTKVAGIVTYCADNTGPGCSSLFSQDKNVILFTPTVSLATNSPYTLIINEAVTNLGGQSITGNRQGGGHKISFTTSGGNVAQQGGFTFGGGGQSLPPYVKSSIPGPGSSMGSNGKIVLEFNQALDATTVTAANFTLLNKDTNTPVALSSVSLDGNEKRFVTLTPSASLTNNNYLVQVLGAVTSANGIGMRPSMQAASSAFTSFFKSTGVADLTAPTVYPLLANNSTAVSVIKVFEFGFSKGLLPSSVNATNATLNRGGTSVNVKVKYDAGKNGLFVIPSSVLAPNTVYTLSMAGLTDLSGNIISTSTYTYTTGAADTSAISVVESRCDDYSCKIVFSKPMNRDTKLDTNFVSSTVNRANISLTQGGPNLAVTTTPINYDDVFKSITINNLALTRGGTFTLVLSGMSDMSGNILPTTALTGTVENSQQTFGSFGDQGMFGPPTLGGSTSSIGGEFKPSGFGSFTPEQFALGKANTAFPFNNTVGQDSNVFQVKFNPGLVLQNGDQVVLTFPDSATVTNAALDTFSPFATNFDQQGGAVVTSTALSVDANSPKVTITLGVSSTPSAGDTYSFDLKKIINPSIPKDFSTGGYTVGIKVIRAGTILVNQTSMPYFLKSGGTNNITVRIFASSAGSPDNVAGSVFLFAGGPAGKMDKNVVLAAGAVSTVDGVSANTVNYTSLPDGCYFFGTPPGVTLSGTDYFGKFSPEPVCVNSGASTTKDIILSASAGGNSVTTTIKITGLTFGGVDLDIFAGGPGRYVVKTLSGVTTTNANGYTIKLPANGTWYIGVGPAMTKGASMGKMVSLPGVPPTPVDVVVSGLGTASSTVTRGSTPLPAGTAFDPVSSTITFTFNAANRTVTGTVVDGTGTGLSNVNVFMHRQGFGMPVFSTTNASGTFSLAVADIGTYGIGANKDGLPMVLRQLEIKANGDIYFDGSKITGANPLVLKMKKASYTISGKVLDANNSAIAGSPVFARENTSGQYISGMTSNDGSYNLFVDNGSWTLQAQLPPDKSDSCGSFTLAVTVAGSSQTNQNIVPSASTCYNLSGTVSVGGANLTNVPVFVEEWDTSNSRPVIGGFKKPATTDSSGAYAVKVSGGGKNYRVGTWHPDYGELNTIATVAAVDVASQNITVASTATSTIVFTGGTSTMNAMIELKNAADSTKTIRKQKIGLDSNFSISPEAGATYNYSVDVGGVGKFSGSLVAGSTTTVALGIAAADFINVTGTVKDLSGNVLSGALITLTNSSTKVMQTALTDSNGNYSANISKGTYNVAASLAGYVAGQASQNASFTTNTTGYNFGGVSSTQAALQGAGNIIKGTMSLGGTAISDGYVWAKNTAGLVVSAPVSPSDGTYSLPVTDGTWVVKGTAGKSAVTTISTIVISGTTTLLGQDIPLTSDSSRIPTSTSGVVAGNAGGTVNDSSGSGIKVTAGAGVLQTGSGNVTMNLQKTYTAPETQNFKPLANATYQISATGNSAIKSLNGNAEIQLKYSDLLAQLPTGVTEGNLKLMYYAPERGDYVPVEGGFTVDTTNHTITGLSSHLTDFVITYAPVAAPAAATVVSTDVGSSGGGGGGGGGSFAVAPVVVAPAASVSRTVPATVGASPAPVSTLSSGLVPPSLSDVMIGRPDSAIVLNVPSRNVTVGGKISYSYQYQNVSKSPLKVTVVRQLVNSKGKVVQSSSSKVTIKPGQIFKKKVAELVGKKVVAGSYQVRIKVLTAKDNKVLEENSFTLNVAKAKAVKPAQKPSKPAKKKAASKAIKGGQSRKGKMK